MDHADWNGFRAYPGNLPLPRPGAYRITNLLNGKVYVGISTNIASRGLNHARAAVKKSGQQGRRLPKFVNALRKYGAGSFLIEPVVYAIGPIRDWRTDGAWLRGFEADLIAEEDAIVNGYNVLENWHGGPHGKVFGAIIGEIMRAVLAAPEIRERMSAAARARIRTPEFEAARLAAAFTPEAIAKRSVKLKGRPSPKKGSKASPETLVKMSLARKGKPNPCKGRKFGPSDRSKAAQRGRMWITDGTSNRRVKIDVPPPGWRAGRSWDAAPKTRERMRTGAARRWADPEIVAKMTRNRKGRVWITDEIRSRTIAAGDPIPDGWRRGRAGFSATMTARYATAEGRAKARRIMNRPEVVAKLREAALRQFSDPAQREANRRRGLSQYPTEVARRAHGEKVRAGMAAARSSMEG